MIDTKSVNEFIDSQDKIGINRINEFKLYEKAFFEKFDGECNLTQFQSVFKFNYENLSVGVNCLNSSWRCYDSKKDKNRIILGERQITESRELINECDIKLAIMHHPIEWLNEFDQKDIKSLISRDYQILMCGHVHEGVTWSKTDLYGSIFVSIAPSNWTYNLRSTSRDISIGYSIIDFDLTKHKITNHFRRYSKNKEKFDPNTDLGNEQGVLDYPIPTTEKISKIYKELEVAQTITNLHFDEINEHLLTFNTDTKAPKNLNDLFVMPRVVEKVKFEIETEDEKEYNLKDLCSSKNNLIIFGTKESGKTVLLDKILIEITSKIEDYQKLPVQIDFQDVGTKRFETIISRYLNIGILEISDYLNNHTIVLLIDNLNFDRSNSHNLNRLEKFLTDHPSVKIIATSHQIHEGEIPLEILEFHYFSSYSYATIKSFNIKEIKALMKNWFVNNNNFKPAKLDSLLHVLLALNLPRSPLAISMFLWILEQQENYKPVNHATMLENFIERIFKKQSKIEIYSDVFDYKNKERLLTEIAFHMLKKDMDNYKLSYAELIEFVDNYLKAKRFDDFSTEAIINHFFDKGLLVKDHDGAETFIRFRFTCFFQYFLTKKMDFDAEFKKFVLSEDQFLKFNNEIDYFTGLKRDQSEILMLIVDRMNYEFKDILDETRTFDHGFDQMFLTNGSFIEKIETAKFIKKISSEKPNEQQVDKLKSKALDGIKPEKGIKKKDKEIVGIKKFDRLWSLAAQVLKNTEETDLENLKDKSYKDIIQCSMAFASLYKYKLDKFFESYNQIEDKNVNSDLVKQLKIQHKVLPLIHQIVIRYLMGTKKLSTVIRDKIKMDLKDENISDFEKYLSIFLYADLKGNDYIDFISSFIKQIQNKYMLDMTLYKLIFYYYFRSNSKESDIIFQNLIADLIIKSKKQTKAHKGAIINDYIELRRKRSSLGDDSIIDV